MDGIRFDALARRLSSARSRRGFFHLLAGAAVAGAADPRGAAVAADCAAPCGDGHLSPVVCCRPSEVCVQQFGCCPSDRVCPITTGVVDCCAPGFHCSTIGEDGSRDCLAVDPLPARSIRGRGRDATRRSGRHPGRRHRGDAIGERGRSGAALEGSSDSTRRVAF